MKKYDTGLPATLTTPLTGGEAMKKRGCISNTLKQVFTVPYEPHPEDLSFLERSQSQSKSDVDVEVAVMSADESKRYFGRSISRRGIQPVYLKVTNRRSGPLFFDCVHLDPYYYPPLEAAGVCHFWNLKQLAASFGLLSVIFLPLLFILPFKLISARKSNKRMDEFFCSQTFPRGFIPEGQTAKGFVFCSLDDGNKIVNVKLLGTDKALTFSFSVPVPGIAVDYEGKLDFLTQYEPADQVTCDLSTLKNMLENEPRATTNASGTREGDPGTLGSLLPE